MKGLTVVSLFPSRSLAEAAVRDLKRAGFTDEHIGMAMQDLNGQRDRAEMESRQNDPAAEGAVTGGLVGGLIGLLGSLLIPGLGPLVLGGVLASTLTAAGIGVAAGGLVGLLTGMGLSERDAELLDRGLRAGGILLTVSAASRTPEALAIIERHRPDLGLTSTGSLDLARAHEPPDRRYGGDPSYSGPERRLAAV
jgi:hypothetical protein